MQRQVELISNSANRLMEALELPRDKGMVVVHAPGGMDSSQAVLGALVDGTEKKGVKWTKTT